MTALRRMEFRELLELLLLLGKFDNLPSAIITCQNLIVTHRKIETRTRTPMTFYLPVFDRYSILERIVTQYIKYSWIL